MLYSSPEIFMSKFEKLSFAPNSVQSLLQCCLPYSPPLTFLLFHIHRYSNTWLPFHELSSIKVGIHYYPIPPNNNHLFVVWLRHFFPWKLQVKHHFTNGNGWEVYFDVLLAEFNTSVCNILYHLLCRFQQLVLESHRQCRFDSVTVYEGHSNAQENMVARFCGDHTSDLPVVTTQSNKAQVVFKSDHSVTREGLWASIEFTYGKLELINC